MLTPKQLERMPQRLIQVMEDLEADIIADICRRISLSGTVTDTALHQMRMLAEQGYSQAYIEERIQQSLKIGQKEIDKAFDEAVERYNQYITNAAKKLGKDDIVTPNRDWRGALDQQVEAIRRQTHEEFYNLTQSMGFAIKRGAKPEFLPVAKAYQRVMDRVTLEVATGTTDYNTAIRNAVSDLAESGLQYITYFPDGKQYKDGRTYRRDHADVAARRALMTGITQLAGRMSEQAMELLDTRYVETEAHIGARDKDGPKGWENHQKWQGKWFYQSKNGEKDPLGKYPDFVKSCGYGDIQGILGVNCSHTFFPVILGIDEPRYTEEELKTTFNPPPIEWKGKMYSAYDAKEKQRWYEREMRKCKRELIANDAAGDEEQYNKWKAKLKKLSAGYKAFSKKAGLPLQMERARVQGFGRAEAAKARSK